MHLNYVNIQVMRWMAVGVVREKVIAETKNYDQRNKKEIRMLVSIFVQ